MTKRRALRILREAGGLLPFSAAAMCRAGFLPASEPLSGDVGIVEGMTTDGVGQGSAIFTGRLWAALTASGLIMAAFPVLATWRVNWQPS